MPEGTELLGIPQPAPGKPLQYVRNPFVGILHDAVRFALLAKDAPEGSEDESLFARSAIAHCAFAIEAAANGCLNHLGVSQALADSLDRLPAIDKFDVAASYYKRDVQIDRGCRAVQLVSDLLNQRNKYVHAKWSRKELTQIASENGGPTFEFTAAESPHLKWYDDRSLWRRAEARQALHAVRDFLRYVFVELCTLTTTDIDRILSDFMEGHTRVTTMRARDRDEAFERARTELGCDLRFLGCVSETETRE